MDINTHASPTEKDFRANEARRLIEFAGLVRVCGSTPAQIAAACNLDKRTVLRALGGQPIKSDAQARIEYFIRQQLQQQGGCQ